MVALHYVAVKRPAAALLSASQWHCNAPVQPAAALWSESRDRRLWRSETLPQGGVRVGSGAARGGRNSPVSPAPPQEKGGVSQGGAGGAKSCPRCGMAVEW